MGFQVSSLGITDLAHEDWEGMAFAPPQAPITESVLAERGVDAYARTRNRRSSMLNLSAVGQLRPVTPPPREVAPIDFSSTTIHLRGDDDGTESGGTSSSGQAGTQPMLLMDADGGGVGASKQAAGAGAGASAGANAGAGANQQGGHKTAAQMALAAKEKGSGAGEKPASRVPVMRIVSTSKAVQIAKTKNHPDIVLDEEFAVATNALGARFVRPHRCVRMRERGIPSMGACVFVGLFTPFDMA